MSFLIQSCCCNGGVLCCKNITIDPNPTPESSLLQCEPPSLESAGVCVANDGTLHEAGMGISCEGQTCIYKSVPLGSIIKHCLHTDHCAYESFESMSVNGAGWLPYWGCGRFSNYTLHNGVDGVVASSTHREILWQPMGGTSGFTSAENQMEVACIPFQNDADPTCFGYFFTDLGVQNTNPNRQFNRDYANTLKDRVTGTVTVETVRGTVAFSIVGDIDRAGLYNTTTHSYNASTYYLHAQSSCSYMLGGVLQTFEQPQSCAEWNQICPVYTYRYGVAAGWASEPVYIKANPTPQAVDATHTSMWCKAADGSFDQHPVFIGRLSVGFTGTDTYVQSTAAGSYTDGSGYQDAAVTFTGGGGTGMAGYCTLNPSTGGVFVIITDYGCGYTSAPTCNITSNTGTGATRTMVKQTVYLNAAWGVSLTSLGEGYGTSRSLYPEPNYYCAQYETVYTCLYAAGTHDFHLWAESGGNPKSDREKLIGAPYEHFLGGNQTFIYRNPVANVSTTTTCGGTQHTQPVRTVTVEITGSQDWTVGGETLNAFPLSTPCDYTYSATYPTQPTVSGTIIIGTTARNPCDAQRYKYLAEYGVGWNPAAFTGTGANASYTTLQSKLSVPVAAANQYPTIITYDYENWGKIGSTPLKKTYYDAFYVYKNPYLVASTADFNLHLDVTQAYAGIAGSSFSVTLLGKDFIGMKKAELRGTTLSPNTANNLNNTILATTTTITNTGINLDPANCTTVTIGFPSTSEHRFMYVFVFNNYIDRSPTNGNGMKQGVFVFGIPTAGNTSVTPSVAYNLDLNQSVYMGGTVQPFKTIGYSRAPNETASIVVDGVTILDNPNNDLPNTKLGEYNPSYETGFGALLPPQLIGTVGTQSVVFTTYGGTVTLSRRQATTPKITAVSISIFPKSGGTTLTLTGLDLNLLSVFKLYYSYDLTSTCSIVSQSATSVVLTTGALTSQYAYQDPQIATYLMDLRATYAAEPLLTWQSGTNYLGGFTFTMVNAPTITSVSPSTLPIAGGTSVVINGKHFVHIISVTFKGVTVTPTVVALGEQMICIAPVNSVGAGQLVITTIGGSVSFPITYV